MKIVDVVIILFLLLGAVIGFKKGFIKTFISFVGVLLTIVLALYLKQPIVNLIYKYLPFFDFGGLSVLNVFLYESVAFLIVYVLLSCILGVIINITGVIEKILNATIILGLVSKILGAIAGVLEMLLFIFIACFALSRISISRTYVDESKLANVILARTPIIANIAAPTYNSINEIYKIQKKYAKIDNKSEYNRESLIILVKNGVLTKKQALDLVKKGKIKIDKPESFIII